LIAASGVSSGAVGLAQVRARQLDITQGDAATPQELSDSAEVDWGAARRALTADTGNCPEAAM